MAAQQVETPYGNVTDVVQLISDLRDAVDGNDDIDQGIVRSGMLNLVPTDANGLAFARSVPQVRTSGRLLTRVLSRHRCRAACCGVLLCPCGGLAASGAAVCVA